jgi:uncharacterized protein YkwD
MKADPRPTLPVRGLARRPLLLVLALLSCLVVLVPLAAAQADADAADALTAGTAPQQSERGPAATAAAARFGPAVLAELNRIRARKHLPAVVIDARMSRTAAAHSREMARRGYLAHGAWGSRVARASGSANAVGEVLGWLRRAGPRNEARGIVRGWLDSPTHRLVLLDARFRRVGIGRAGGRLRGVDAAIYTVDWASAR